MAVKRRRVDAETFSMTVDPEEQWSRVEIRDSLTTSRAGASASRKAREIRREHPLQDFRARLTREPSDSRNWRKGATGERVVALHLRRLDRAEWHVFHDVPIGAWNANVDHVVIGPAGVYTINTKNRKGHVVVTPRMIKVNGHREDYLRKAVDEAQRTARLLSEARGAFVLVRPILVFIADEFEIRNAPGDVTVVRAGGLVRWLKRQPPTLEPRERIAIAGAAHKPATWAH
jgi:Nuclease-related domain